MRRPYKRPNYPGDLKHCISCKSGCVVGDKVAFERAVYTGGPRQWKLDHIEAVFGEITAAGVGKKTGKITFTIQMPLPSHRERLERVNLSPLKEIIESFFFATFLKVVKRRKKNWVLQ